MYIYGKNTVNESLKTNKSITQVYVSNTLGDDINRIKKITKEKGIKLTILSNQEMNQKFGKNNQGMVALIVEYEYKELNYVLNKTKNKDNVAIAILDGLEDPHNLGAIMRTADATGMDAIIIPKNRSVSLNSTVAKVSTGAIEHVDVVQATNLVQTIKKLQDEGFWIIGLDMDGSVDYRTQDYSGKIAVVIGSEGSGISRLVKENCDFNVHIPMYGHVNSLNASVSASIIFYEIIRNR
jgi:23S rRNA (guanosine2251-2'-O)-methyltransferase